jgi:acetyl esterase/lipase/L-ascorbate metabolism protein UlaG (beta-lactamase superfamily)
VRTTRHPASPEDLRAISDVLKRTGAATGDARAGANPDTGNVMLDHGRSTRTPPFATTPWRAGEVTGEWVAAAGTAGEAVALYLHGRRFQHEEPPDAFAAHLSHTLGMPVLLLHYRLAPAHPYPAALRDVLTALHALLRRCPASRVLLVGHSAGATLALSALTELAGVGHALPTAAAAISPITDFTFSGASIITNDGKDGVAMAELDSVRQAYLGDADPAGSPQSPLFADPAGFPPLLLCSGSNELLLDDTLRFAERADAAGVEVELDIFDEMIHGFPAVCGRAADTMFARIAEFGTSWLRGGPEPPPQPLTVRRVGWAGYRITTEQGTRVLVDPYQAGSVGFHNGLPESPVTAEELSDSDVVAVTHAAPDHRGEAIEIVRSGQAILVCGPALYQHALSHAVPARRCAPMVSGVEFRFRDVTIKALDARHASSMYSDGGFLSDQPLSFLLTTAAGTRILCGGDFSLSSDLKTWRELYRPQIAVLGIGGVRLGPVTVTELPPAEAAIAATWLGVHTVIPVHYPPGDPAPAQLAADLAGHDERIQVATLQVGETWTSTSGTRPRSS